MLEKAAAKLRGLDTSETNTSSTQPRGTCPIEFLRHPFLPFPFPDEVFDAVCALEVLELFTDMDEPIRELTRVLRPGGVLLTSRGTEESGRKAKIKNTGVFTSLLQKHGMEQIQIAKWWKLFDRVTARKHGNSQPIKIKTLSDVLICSACSSKQWSLAHSGWTCQICGNLLAVTREGIILN